MMMMAVVDLSGQTWLVLNVSQNAVLIKNKIFRRSQRIIAAQHTLPLSLGL